MKNALAAVVLVLGVSMWGSAFACDGKGQGMSAGTSTPASPTTVATAK